MDNKLLISAVLPQKRKKDRYNIFIDGEYAASLGSESCVVFGIKTGALIDEGVFLKAIQSDNTKYAFDSAVFLLSHKMRTIHEITTKLAAKKIDEGAIDAAVEKLKEYGYLNDEEYAKEYVQSAILAAKYGRKVIEYKLKSKGISDEFIELAMRGFTFDIEKAIAEKNLSSLIKKHKDEDTMTQRRKIYAALSRRGFNYDIINTLLSEDE